MAATTKKTRTAKKAPRRRPVTPGRQAARTAWSPGQLLAAIKKPTMKRRLEILHEVGILDKNGKLARKYRSWGNRVSRTPEVEEAE